MGLLRHEHNRSRASIVVDEGADRHDPRAGGVVLEGQLAGAEAARRFNDVALGFQFQFKALLTGDTGGCCPVTTWPWPHWHGTIVTGLLFRFFID